MSNENESVPAFTTKDSGQREEFKTGAVRDVRGGKGRFDLLPYPAILRIAQLYERGALKYSDRNWQAGMPFSRVLDSAIRHIMQWSGGDRSEDHLAACAWNCMALMSYEQWVMDGKIPKELNDMPAPQDFTKQFTFMVPPPPK